MKIAWIKSTAALGDNLCHSTACVIYEDGFCGIIDFGTEKKTDALIEYLKSKKITHIDILALSHYHGDHTGDRESGRFNAGITNLLSAGFDFTGATCYLPHGCIDWSKGTGMDYSDRATKLKAQMAEKSIKVVEPDAEGYTVPAGSANISFYNVTAGKFANYYGYKKDEYDNETSKTNYNNFSMIAILDDGRTVTAFPGDIEYPAQEQNYPVFEGVDILTVEHHGLNYRSSKKYLGMLSQVKHMVVPYYIKYNQAVRPLSTVSFGLRKGATVYDTLNGGTIEWDGRRMRSEYHKVSALSTDNGTPVYLPAGTDLRTLSAGDYYVQNYAIAKQIKNYPSGAVGGKIWGGARIKVLVDAGRGSTTIHKTILLYNIDCSDKYAAISQYNGETWSAWKYLKFE